MPQVSTDLLAAYVCAGVVGFTGLLAYLQVSRRRARQDRDSAALEEKIAKNLHVPPSLHPVIDTEKCIGSLACLGACPENVLGIVDGVAKLVHPEHCIGHATCVLECPVGAVKLVMGTAERGVDLPEVDENFESNRPGIHIIGELGGMALIRNAIEQGLRVARRLAQVMPKGRGEIADVAIVGAGPAGLAAAFGLRAAGLTYHVLEQSSVGGSIAHYPRHKVVMTEPMKIPLYGKIGARLISKEKLLESWHKAIEKGGIRVREGVKVESVEGEDGAFVLRTNKGRVRARKVILATGQRGSPRKLGAPGEELPKVAYGLVDPAQYDRAKVLVVGAGDAALEAAIQLATESRAEVTMSYRGEAFARAREANRAKVEALSAKRRVRVLFSSQVKRIEERSVALEQKGRAIDLPNDFVLVLIGGEPPVEFLKRAGVGMRRLHGKTVAIPIPGRLKRGVRRRRALLYVLAAAAVAAFLAVRGWEYYPLGAVERLRSPLHRALRPSGSWGHAVGLAATASMLFTFLYVFRKRLRMLQGRGAIRTWLDLHVFAGFLAPILTAFHAAFRSNNLIATSTAVALAIVLLTGIVGGFVYGMVPSSEGRSTELADLAGRFERIRQRAQPMLGETRAPARLQALLAQATGEIARGSLLRLVVSLPASALRLRYRLWRVRALVGDRERRARLRDALIRLNRLRFQIAFYDRLRRSLRVWRVLHASFAGFLAVTVAAHIALTLFLVGYGRR